ncbi:DUF697 domain-containing protein [Helicobacter muridarum]|uniref:DUF697 domain-containing protein n=1 Tax=Helicobacter muridarum TaxID=216 RepID=UPI001315594C|nr:DUF697 domain-containing protein [Helicobacter muridarum]
MLQECSTPPIPFADIALLLPAQMAMIAHISYIYGLEMNEENIKKITLALAGVAVLGFGVRISFGTFLKFVPVFGTFLG